MVGDYDEAVMEVEPGCGLVDGIHHDEPSGSGLAGSDGLSQRLGQEYGTEALPVIARVNGQSREQDHADGVARQAGDKRRRGLGSKYGTHGEAEVAGDTFATDEYERASNVHPLGGEGVDLQPAVEDLVAGLKAVELVVGTEPLEAAVAHVSGRFG